MTVTKTGGRFDRAEGFAYFLAADIQTLVHVSPAHEWLLIAINEINSDEDMQVIEDWAAAGKRIFIDSGIFWLTMNHARKHGLSFDEMLNMPPEKLDGFDALFDKYCRIIDRVGDKVWGYIELDQGGRDNKIKTREKLEKLGYNPIPVYHPMNDGWDYFDYLAERYDRICFGNVSQTTGMTRMQIVATAWERHRKYPDLWIHLLGLTPNEWLYALPVNSGDSSAWLNVVRWNGYKPKACGKSFGGLPKNFQYEIGSDGTSEKGHRKARRMGAYGSYMLQRNWRNHLRRLEAQGFELYPSEKED
jgi:hypothetical protein